MKIIVIVYRLQLAAVTGGFDKLFQADADMVA